MDGEIATITLDRPDKRNAQTFATWSALARIGDTLPEQVRVVVVRGEGPSFSAGIDLRMFTPEGVPGQGSFSSAARLDSASFEQRLEQAQQGFLWLRRPEIVSIAAVQGHAIGAGFQLALACDLRIVADDVKFCMKEPALGLVPDLTGTKPLVDLVGLARAIEHLPDGPDRGRRRGLPHRPGRAGGRRGRPGEGRTRLAAPLLSTNRDAAAATKRLLQGGAGRTLEEQCAAEGAEQAAAAESPVRLVGS